MSTDKLQQRFIFPENDCFLLLTGALLISEKLDFKIKIPRNVMCYHAVMFPNFSVFLKSHILLPRAQNQNNAPNSVSLFEERIEEKLG